MLRYFGPQGLLAQEIDHFEFRDSQLNMAEAVQETLLGKTGTTNEMKDAWFVGYTPSVLTGVWVGYDDHTISLGKGETGGRAACPIWLYFMDQYLKDKPVQTFPIPQGIVFARVNAYTGAAGQSEDSGTVYVALNNTKQAQDGASQDGQTGPARPSLSSVSTAPSPSESYFKSDLF